MDLSKYYKTIQALADPIYVCNASGYISLYNQAAAALWGREPELNSEKFCAAIRIKNSDGTVMQWDSYPVVRSLRYNIPIQSEELIMERPDGSLRRVIHFATPIYNLYGQLDGVVNRMVDVTKSMDNQAVA